MKKGKQTHYGKFDSPVKDVVNELEKLIFASCKNVSIDLDSLQRRIPFYKDSSKELKGFLEDLFKLMKMQFSAENDLHRKLLFALHYSVTNWNKFPPLEGEQWITLGFQSTNPSHDFRGTGIPGILLPLILFSRFPKVSKKIIQAAHSPERPFPMMLVLIVCVNCTFETICETDLIKNSDNRTFSWNIIIWFFVGLVDNVATKWLNHNWKITKDFKELDYIMKDAKENCFNVVNDILQIIDKNDKMCLYC